jgi:hypothetical protein
MTKYGKLTAFFIAAWFVFALVASGLHRFSTGPNQPPISLGLAAVTPLILFLVWFAASPQFRQFAMNLNPAVLTLVQSWRILGFVFLALAAYGILPRLSALPAGWGDIVIGATAPLVGLTMANAGHRRSFIAWQLLGMADLVTAVILNALAGVIDPHGVAASAMTVLPMSLIPTFGVPLFMILHVICIAQAVRWRPTEYSAIRQQLNPHSA